jgi:hypothetical protein
MHEINDSIDRQWRRGTLAAKEANQERKTTQKIITQEKQQQQQHTKTNSKIT